MVTLSFISSVCLSNIQLGWAIRYPGVGAMPFFKFSADGAKKFVLTTFAIKQFHIGGKSCLVLKMKEIFCWERKPRAPPHRVFKWMVRPLKASFRPERPQPCNSTDSYQGLQSAVFVTQVLPSQRTDTSLHQISIIYCQYNTSMPGVSKKHVPEIIPFLIMLQYKFWTLISSHDKLHIAQTNNC